MLICSCLTKNKIKLKLFFVVFKLKTKQENYNEWIISQVQNFSEGEILNWKEKINKWELENSYDVFWKHIAASLCKNIQISYLLQQEGQLISSEVLH